MDKLTYRINLIAKASGMAPEDVSRFLVEKAEGPLPRHHPQLRTVELRAEYLALVLCDALYRKLKEKRNANH